MKSLGFVELDLLRKYDRPGPRYTSYPPAPAFTPEFGPEDFQAAIRENNAARPRAELSLYFHIPFCDTLCYFCGCTMLVTHRPETIRKYLDHLEREIALLRAWIAPERKVTQLHWGGGTPSYLSPEEIRELAGFIAERFPFGDDPEVGVEIDPRGLTLEHMRAFRESGFNRVSLGVQDFDPVVQQAINRIQPEELTRRAIEWARELGFRSLNIDLIYGLPFQTLDSFARTLERVIALEPDRIAVFNFAYVPWLKPHQRLIRPEDLPAPETKLRLLKLTIETLSQAGYVYIGMDHFAKPEDELARAQREKTLYRNFQGYSTRAGADLYAFGMSAISQFDRIYAQNFKELKLYYTRIAADTPATALGYRLTDDDVLRRHVIMRLMCDMELTKADVEEQFGVRFDEYFADALARLEEFVADGLLRITDEKLIVTDLGRLVIRNIAMCFDAHLERMMRERPIFSRTV
ncbi:MAG: oxygen-independent coproporphyrinogen III oxidase [Blastocatellia bacterium]|nr:oxygen-independent coproporphyrinogen III oxidase [Blastocatellia bacterium]MCS7156182.1 oxygen-independent coproporphyrinogen III oxidase [Blastocatellia bacterium]MCX7751468.1 oxygen-independent coproporphyrinogen III oxidase [Blastocatellia bacterium]MDW8169181.1 oxygen-independent coproporphyrinogen III oxidase [Acidobacteriota bacterium]MDW8256042.1 oxygen-independent coproporphyrinogen III oxidase [Acidobacteriota bacterium]